MNRLLIYQYINKLTKDDIINFCNKNNIIINNEEVNIIYSYVKNDYKRFFNNPINVLNEIKLKVNNNTFSEIMTLYNKYKNFI